MRVTPPCTSARWAGSRTSLREKQRARIESYYLSNLRTGSFGVRFAWGKRITGSAGYSIVDDAGDGRSTPTGAGTAATLPAFQAVQTFPLRFQSPLAHISLRLDEHVRLNVGYERYGYQETFSAAQAFRANTGYAGLQWSF